MILVYYFLFPGFLITFILGGIASWIERKVTAKIQARVGPPFLQPFYDIHKLFIKEITIPEQASRALFMIAPFLSFACMSLIAMIVGLNFINSSFGFTGDVIVCVYLFLFVPLFLMLGASASGNPLASLGVSREIKLILSYELVFWTVAAVVFIKTGHIRIGNIMQYQLEHGSVIGSLSGIIAFIIVIFCMQAKLGRVPFDIAEAETEIASGIYIEFSGPLLGFFKITQYMMLITFPAFIMQLFWPPASIIGGILKYVMFLVIVILLENTNPRLRIDQAVRFFWFGLFPLGLSSIILTILGL